VQLQQAKSVDRAEPRLPLDNRGPGSLDLGLAYRNAHGRRPQPEESYGVSKPIKANPIKLQQELVQSRSSESFWIYQS
jgi:hypothetical protein